MQDLKMPPIRLTQKFEEPKPMEAGSAPIVKVQTIAESNAEQQWLKDEAERKDLRKIEAFRQTFGTAEGELFDKMRRERLEAGDSEHRATVIAAEAIKAQRARALQESLDGKMAINPAPLRIVSSDAELADKAIATAMEVTQAQEVQLGAPSTDAKQVKTIDIGTIEHPDGSLRSYSIDVPVDAERAKYEKMWAFEQYRAVAPGEGIAARFLDIAKPKAGSEVIDFGAGTGRGALMLAIMGMKVKMLDFATNCLDEDVRNALTTQSHVLSFAQQDLRQPVPHTAEYGYCTDVMEHIEPEHVPAVLGNILRSAQHVFFQISCVDDVCGQLIGEPLHLSVHPYAWWHDVFTKLGCVFHWSKDEGDSCLFYVSAWISGKDIVDVGTINTTMEQVRANVDFNMQQGYKQVSPHETNDMEVMILGNGPSLGRSLADIRRLKAEGVKIITLNGAYQFCRANDLLPVNQVVVDARAFNERFTHPVEEGCNYFIASQCDPSVLEGLPKERVYLWHTTAESIKDILDKYEQVSWGIPGGSTVLLRAIPLFRMLGFTKFHLFGCDSCCDEDGTHHTTFQPENNNKPFPVHVGGRTFQCHPDQFSQAQEFMDLIKMMGSVIELEVYGNGLLAWILQTGADLADLQAEKTATPTADEQFVL